MKPYFTLLIALLISIASFAQQGINYKAVIKDGSGNIVAGQTINVKFLIIEDTGSTVVYAENHTNVMTDANGIIVLNIGEGTPTTNTFASINWGSVTHSLKTEIDIERDGSFVKFLETPFKTVPYALNAANVSGLEKITESINPSTGLPIYGWRLIGAIPANYGSIGENAVDLSNSVGESTEQGATGLVSNAFGNGTIASGEFSTAMGFATSATNHLSTAMGNRTIASGIVSTAMGNYTLASGQSSTAMGVQTSAPSFAETVVGSNNTTYIPNESDDWNSEDRLFVIGNGIDSDNTSNALTVLKNGTITAPSLTNALITTAGNKALITKEYVDANSLATGLEAINEGNGIGWRLKGANPANYGPIGENAVDLSINNSESMTNGASGGYSTAIGLSATASGDFSTAMGYTTTASGDDSTAMGSVTNASGTKSTAMGYSTTASGNSSTAMGRDTTAPSYVETVIGHYNELYTPANTTNWDSNDRLFVIGNGTSNSNRKNALTVLKNGIITAPSLSTSLINAGGNRALVTKEYSDANGATGLEQITESNKTGWRLKGVNPLNYANIGSNAVDLSIAPNNFYQSGATGTYSFATGLFTTATGDSSTATGENTKALGKASNASGLYTTASGYYSTAMGDNTTAPSQTETVLGRSNIPYTPVSTTSWNSNDRLFVIGNGSIGNENNALTVIKNGRIGVNTSIPGSLFEIVHENVLPTPTNRTNALSIKNSNTNNSFQLATHSNGSLTLYANGNYIGYFNNATGTYVAVSDRRLKKDITTLENGTLKKVLQLNPVSYLMKDQKDTNRNLGLISQEVQELFPSITHYSKEQDILTLSYTELIPILIKALQEQQSIIDKQNEKIEAQGSENTQQNANIDSLLQRMTALEVVNNQ